MRTLSEKKKARLRGEIAVLNRMMQHTRTEDRSYERAINEKSGCNAAPEIKALATNNQAVISQKIEIAKRAQQLGISYQDALAITE